MQSCCHVVYMTKENIYILTFPSPMTELTFLEVFFPKAQMQAHSAGTVKLANDHWLSTYWPITGPTFPTRASLWDEEEQRREDHDGVCLCVKRTQLAESGLTQSDGWVWCLWVQRYELCLCHWMRTRRMSHGWSWCWKEKPQVSFYNCQTDHSVARLH